jgi:hypothetical protein
MVSQGYGSIATLCLKRFTWTYNVSTLSELLRMNNCAQ